MFSILFSILSLACFDACSSDNDDKYRLNYILNNEGNSLLDGIDKECSVIPMASKNTENNALENEISGHSGNKRKRSGIKKSNIKREFKKHPFSTCVSNEKPGDCLEEDKEIDTKRKLNEHPFSKYSRDKKFEETRSEETRSEEICSWQRRRPKYRYPSLF